ncbi:MAG: Gfo/Idh/MocA family oxidoreductase [candidate division Zixibacteria bacterium]|nr:Gfo/Idh/MocA family oxidoreductase [candidate division Zixibacteria bacterium]
MSKNFALTGVSGYVAPRHLKAIKDTGNELIATLDPHDSAGVLDSYFDNVRFFTDFERFDRHIEKLRRENHDKSIHYLSICSPNYLHDAHARFALRVGADAICEKPLVLNPWNIDALAELEQEYGKNIYTILQLRVHPSLIALKKKLLKEKPNRKKDIRLTYITTRGGWYLVSWKGQLEQSGGLATNIGIHFFDLLMWLFGKVQHSEVHYATERAIGGFLELENARVRWFLSIDKADLPTEISDKGQRTFRSITMDDEEIEFSGGFTDLHTIVYRETLAGRGFGLADARPSIELVHDLRQAPVIGVNDNTHPLLAKKAKNPKTA